MKNYSPTTLLIITFLVITLVAVANSVCAFHSGGVGACDGCHTMHNYQDGISPIWNAGPALLKGSDTSSVCLHCHESGNYPAPKFVVSTSGGAVIPSGVIPAQLTPGGDFAWLKKTFSWWANAADSTMSTSPGERHGHNIVAMDYQYEPDSTKQTAPGGSYPSANLSCISCHDPHGKYRMNLDGTVTTTGTPIKGSGSYVNSPAPDSLTSVGVYRMLGGSGYAPSGILAGLAFTYGPPAAVAPSDYNRSEATSSTRVAYGTGMSEWCRNCHNTIHGNTESFKHVSPGSMLTTDNIADYYNSYVKTGDLTGAMATSYLSLVPFEVGSSSVLKLQGIVTSTPTKGPDSGDGTPQVMCLSCHRAHASCWDGIMRWNSKNSQIVKNGNYSEENQLYQPFGQGRTEAEALQGYYQTPASKFDLNQLSLCTKCHSTVPQ